MVGLIKKRKLELEENLKTKKKLDKKKKILEKNEKNKHLYYWNWIDGSSAYKSYKKIYKSKITFDCRYK